MRRFFEREATTRAQARKVVYALSAFVTLISGVSGLTGFVRAIPARVIEQIWPMMIVPIVLSAGFFALITYGFMYFSKTGKLIGKLLCLVGTPWIGFSVMSRSMLPAYAQHQSIVFLLIPGIGGFTLLVIGFVLLVIDQFRLSD
jgi:hypothetical protein